MPRIKEENTSAVQIRVNKIVEVILENPSYFKSKINAELTEFVRKEFSLSQRQSQRYIKWAREAILELIKDRKSQSLENAIIDREYLMKKAKETYDYKLALEVVKDRDKILGLYEDKITHSGEVAVTFVEKLDE